MNSRTCDFQSGSYAQYELQVKLENYKPGEISVIVKDDGKQLLIDARYESDHPDYGQQTHVVMKQFMLPPSIDSSMMRGRFSAKTGMLVIYIPSMKIMEPGWSFIPIQFEYGSKGHCKVST